MRHIIALVYVLILTACGNYQDPNTTEGQAGTADVEVDAAMDAETFIEETGQSAELVTSECGNRITQLASDSPIGLDNGWTVGLVNESRTYNDSDAEFCGEYFGDDSTLATQAEINNIFVKTELSTRLSYTTVVKGKTVKVLCPVPVFVIATNGSKPSVTAIPDPLSKVIVNLKASQLGKLKAKVLCVNDGID